MKEKSYKRCNVTISINASLHKVFKDIKSRRGYTLSGLVDEMLVNVIVDELKELVKDEPIDKVLEAFNHYYNKK